MSDIGGVGWDGGWGVIWKVCIWFRLERCVEIRGTECCVRVNWNPPPPFFFYSVVKNKQSRGGRQIKTWHFTPSLTSPLVTENTTFWSVSWAKTSPFIGGFKPGQWDCYEMVILSISTSSPPNFIFRIKFPWQSFVLLGGGRSYLCRIAATLQASF